MSKDRYAKMSRRELDAELKKRSENSTERIIAYIRSVTLPDDDIRKVLRKLDRAS